MKPITHTIRSGDKNICVFEWPGDSPPIVLVHATGFHARCWDQVIKHLNGKHVFAIDVLGHGRSDKPTPPVSWERYTLGVIDCITTLNLNEITGVGHSMGGLLITAAAAKLKERFRSLILFDPVIMTAENMQMFRSIVPENMFIARRRNHFLSPEEMFESFEKKENFSQWNRDVLWDYCNYGLLPHGEGYELACPPLIEAETYKTSGDTAWIYDQIKKITIPVKVIRAKQKTSEELPFSFEYSPTNPELASLFQNGTDNFFPNMTHFFPMETPELAAKFIAEKKLT
jgi:pimeloyl-ACP methyl ester carboxylesterase